MRAVPRLIVLDRVRSTNDAALRLARRGVPDGTAVWARWQTAGRGRKQRHWVSPPGNAYLSLIADAPFAGAERMLPYVAGVAAAEALRSHVAPGVGIRLKWPNDLVVGERKVGGILVERASRGRFVIGLGVNVEVLPGDVGQPVTTLRALGSGADVATVVTSVRQRLLLALAELAADGFEPVRARWLALARDIGRPVDLSFGGRLLRGTLLDVDSDGVAVLGSDVPADTGVRAPTFRFERIHGPAYARDAA